MPKKIIVAMSGGVDSSVAAALLKKQGFVVIGVFMKFWLARRSPGEGGKAFNRCCSSDAERRAREVASILDIPFYVFNFEKEFKKRVVDYFLKEYAAGRTPNPCVVCNKDIKFGLLLERTLSLKADFIATGHYVRKAGNKLFKGKDKEKDQSYFLWQLSQKQLKHSLFPLGSYTKKQVKEMAKKFGLPVLSIPESQEICFVENTIGEFLTKYIKQKKGEIVDAQGKVLGEHQGLSLYTIGQRRGLGFIGGPAFAKPACRRGRASAGKPYWVLRKDLKMNVLVITKDEEDLFEKELFFKEANWISGKSPKVPAILKATIRYRHKVVQGVLQKGNRFIFNKPQRAITPGQSIVFYLPRRQAGKGQELLGGGIIR
ncbi:MAG: tRNA 2-thiouridine(34) synthase MnmA [Candidatus Nealsonbacteria bacterium]|nr:tRNA 2-thiouridine(34) synthase MnmA [Candidatus Nealsonbacteria bacterium]